MRDCRSPDKHFYFFDEYTLICSRIDEGRSGVLELFLVGVRRGRRVPSPGYNQKDSIFRVRTIASVVACERDSRLESSV